MNTEMGSIDSNQVCDLVEAPANINPLVVSGSIRGKEDLMGRLRPLRQGLLQKDILRGRALTMRKPFCR